MMKNKRFIVYFLMAAGMIMLVAPLIPHHHHSNGIICMKDDIKDTECPCHHHNHHNGDPCCTSDCIARFESSIPAPHLDEALSQNIHSITLFFEPLFRFITQYKETPAHRDYVYIESLYGTFITCAAGLRAPPLSFFI